MFTCCKKWSSVINSIYSGQQVFSCTSNFVFLSQYNIYKQGLDSTFIVKHQKKSFALVNKSSIRVQVYNGDKHTSLLYYGVVVKNYGYKLHLSVIR